MLFSVQQAESGVINAAATSITFAFDSISQGQAAVVSASVPGSLPSSQWQVQVNGQTVATGYGAGPIGPVYVGPGQNIVVTGQPLSGLVFTPAIAQNLFGTAVITGTRGSLDDIDPVPVSEGGGTPGPFNYLAEQLSASTAWTFPAPSPLAQGIFIVANEPLVSVKSVGSGTLSLPFISLGPGPSTAEGMWYVPVPPLVYAYVGNQELVATFSSAATGVVLEVDDAQDWGALALAAGSASINVSSSSSNPLYTKPALTVLQDSSGAGQTLKLLNGLGDVAAFATITSPLGSAFGQAIETLNAYNLIQGPAGASIAQGAVTGGTFGAKIRLQLASITNGGSFQFILGRSNGSSEWLIYLDGTHTYPIVNWYDASAGAHVLSGTSVTLAAATNYEIELDWNGATLYLFVNGTLAGSLAVTTAQAPSSANSLAVGEYNSLSVGSIVDEIAVYSSALHTGTYTVPTGPLLPDGNTIFCLYEFDINSPI